MAHVTLTELWVHLASDLSQYVTTRGFGAEDVSVSKPVDVRTTASGRRRSFTKAGGGSTISVTFPRADRETIATLEEWAGVPVMVRDPSGRLVWGVYGAVDTPEAAGQTHEADVSFTLTSTSEP